VAAARNGERIAKPNTLSWATWNRRWKQNSHTNFEHARLQYLVVGSAAELKNMGISWRAPII